MLLLDVNVLVNSYREDAEEHERYRAWVEGIAKGDEPFGLSDLACSGFLRIVTHPRIFSPPSTVEDALIYLEGLRGRTNCVPVLPGPRHWEIFVEMVRRTGARGNLVPDAYFAALAIESGNEWITIDRDFRRFPGLRWRHPLN